jgi:hypothetical protein
MAQRFPLYQWVNDAMYHLSDRERSIVAALNELNCIIESERVYRAVNDDDLADIKLAYRNLIHAQRSLRELRDVVVARKDRHAPDA